MPFTKGFFGLCSKRPTPKISEIKNDLAKKKIKNKKVKRENVKAMAVVEKSLS